MKRLFGLSLLAMILLIGSASAQDTVYVWYGGSFDSGYNWNNIQIVAENADNAIPVYIMCTAGAYVADIHLPLGVNDIYIDAIPQSLCSYGYPFTAWDDASFLNAFETSPPNPAGWHSRSFLGFHDTGGGPNPRLYFTVPTNCLTFVVHTLPLVLPDTLGDTICGVMQNGVSSTLGGPAAGDTLGGAGFPCITNFACFYYSPNTPPTIDVTGSICVPGDDNCLDFFAFDDDGDPLTITADVGTLTITADSVGADGNRYVHGKVCVDASCGLTNSGVITVTADDGIDTASDTGPYEAIGVITVSMPDSVGLWPGYVDSFPVTMDAGACFCLGGFELTVVYDASIFTITGVTRGAFLAGAEYWFVNPNVNPAGCPELPFSGAFKVVMINDLNNQVAAPPLCGVEDEVLFWIHVMARPDFNYPSNFCVPICFYICYDDLGGQNFWWNAVTNKTGYNVWKTEGCQDTISSTYLLVLECGNLKIYQPGDVVVGDVNHNLQPYEIGDVVTLANYLIDPVNNPLDLWQLWASDINHDGRPATVADLIMLINIINGTIQPGPKLAPLDATATITYANGTVSVTSDVAVGGALVTINHEGVELGAPVANGMELKYHDANGVMTVLVYNGTINAGTHTLFTVPVNGEGSVTLGEVSASDNIGHLLNARGVVGVVPTEFSVAQNFPNPFNAKTAIKFALPTTSNVTVTIYNVAGQVVETIDAGELPAGEHSVTWDATNISSGVYFYKVAAGQFSETMKMTLLK